MRPIRERWRVVVREPQLSLLKEVMLYVIPRVKVGERTCQSLWGLLTILNAAEILPGYVPTNHYFPNALTISHEKTIVSTLSLHRGIKKRNVVLSCFSHFQRNRSINSRVSLWNKTSTGPRFSAEGHSQRKCHAGHCRLFLPWRCFSSHFSSFFPDSFLTVVINWWVPYDWEYFESEGLTHLPWAEVHRGSVCLKPYMQYALRYDIQYNIPNNSVMLWSLVHTPMDRE